MNVLYNNMNSTNFAIEQTEHFRSLKNDTMLHNHQLFVVDYLKTHSGLLVKHDLGTGKSLIMAALLAEQLNQVIFLSAKSLHGNTEKAISDYLQKSGKTINIDYQFVTMNASNMIEQIKRATEKGINLKFHSASKLNLDNKTLIVDEAHNLFNSITNGSANAMALYDAVMRAKGLRVVFLTGTPIVNHPFELVPCYNMIARREVLPTSFEDFNKFFIDISTGTVKNRDKFQNRIVGLTSYYGNFYGIELGTSDFPKSLPIKLERVPMSDYQFQWYSVARDLEIAEASRSKGAKVANLQKPKGQFTSSYMRLSRQFSNIVYPSHAMEAGRNIKLLADKVQVSDFNLIEKYSPKMSRLYANLVDPKNEGKHLVYSSFVESGINMLAMFLIANGWEEYGADLHKKVTKKSKKGQTNNEFSDEDIEGLPINLDDDYELELPVTKSRDANNKSNADDAGDDNNVTKDADGELFGHNADDADEDADDKPDDKPDETISNEIIKVEIEDTDTADAANVAATAESAAAITGSGPQKSNKAAKKAVKAAKMVTKKAAIKLAKGPEVTAKNLIKKMPKEVTSKELDARLRKTIVPNKNKFKFLRITGQVAAENRHELISKFNSEDNMFGNNIKLIMISGAGAEGLDLKCVRFIHILEYFWNEMRIKQVIGRGVRYKSHEMLPAKYRDVQPFVYISEYPKDIDHSNVLYKNEKTTDNTILEKAVRINKLINHFYYAIAEAAIDCAVHNQNNKLRCRVCTPTGEPLYHEDIFTDMQIRSPCKPLNKQEIMAKEIVIEGKNYALYDGTLLEFKPELNGYIEVPRNDPVYVEYAKKFK